MTSIIEQIFGFITYAFEKIPLLNKFKGWRSVLGFIGLGVIAILQMQHIGSVELLNALHYGFLGFTGLSLLAKGQ